jgi:molybdate ABC transporter permease protein
MTLPADMSPLWISLATTSAATAFTFLLGLVAARALYGTRGSLRAWIDGILTLPLVLPPTVVGFFLLLIFGRRSPVGHALENLGLMIAFSWPATVIAATVVSFPLMYRTTLGAFEQVNPTLLDAARTLGASEWRVFRRVLLPLAGPGVLAGTVLAFARALGEFGATLMLAGNIPGRTQTMPIAIFSAAEGGQMGDALVWVILIVALSMAIIRLLNYQKRRRATGAALLLAEPAAAAATTLAWHPRGRSDAHRVAEQPGTLDVNVEKRLDGFHLRVQFQTGTGTLGVLGASGAGKSMTFRLIAGVATPDRGHIRLHGRALYDSSSGENLRPAQRRIGIVFQDYALFPHLTVAENVGFALGRVEGSERSRRIQQQLERMHIAELAGRYPRELSGGQRQRVAVARALVSEPDALLLDEPFAALDPHLRRRMEEQLRETLADYAGTVLFVTHDMEEAFRFCTDLLVLDRGRVIASGPRQELFEHPRSVAAARLTGCKNVVAAQRIDAHRIAVPAWGCELEAQEPVPDALRHVGYRSHQFSFPGTDEESAGNIFPCWPVTTSEAPHEMTVYLRLHAPPAQADAPHLQADVPKEFWRELSMRPLPWMIRLDPARLLLLDS